MLGVDHAIENPPVVMPTFRNVFGLLALPSDIDRTCGPQHIDDSVSRVVDDKC